jgi:hypothetical protein
MEYKYGDVIVPNGKSGNWEVSDVLVSKFDEAISSRHGSVYYCPAGIYRRLTYHSSCVMSNTPMELRTNREFIWKAKGHVHINGLGLAEMAMLDKMSPSLAEFCELLQRLGMKDFTPRASSVKEKK